MTACDDLIFSECNIHICECGNKRLHNLCELNCIFSQLHFKSLKVYPKFPAMREYSSFCELKAYPVSVETLYPNRLLSLLSSRNLIRRTEVAS